MNQRKADRRYKQVYGSSKQFESDSEDNDENGIEVEVAEKDETYYPDIVPSKSEETKLPS